MQLTIVHHLNQSLILPINYNYIVQSALYRHLQENGLETLHDEGYDFYGRQYRFFTFGQLQGHYQIKDKQIIFDGDMILLVRSIDEKLILRLQQGIFQNGIRYGNMEVRANQIRMLVSKNQLSCDCVEIKTISPIVVYQTNDQVNRTVYYGPSSEKFCTLLNDNFVRKYTAWYGKYPEENIKISNNDSLFSKKVITRYKNFLIEGWHCGLILKGQKEYLNFLYQVGLGAKNSQGFGMFDILDG